MLRFSLYLTDWIVVKKCIYWKLYGFVAPTQDLNKFYKSINLYPPTLFLDKKNSLLYSIFIVIDDFQLYLVLISSNWCQLWVSSYNNIRHTLPFFTTASTTLLLRKLWPLYYNCSITTEMPWHSCSSVH